MRRELLPFYPVLYVAWADGELTPEEAAAVEARLAEAGVSTEIAAPWLDPSSPPEPETLIALLSRLRERARTLVPAERRTLADLGRAFAAAEGRRATAAEVEAIGRLEAALGLTGTRTASTLLHGDRPVAELEESEPPFRVGEMARWLDGRQAGVRERVREIISRPPFEHEYGLSTREQRERILDWSRTLAGHGLGALALPERYGGGGDPAAFVAALETIAMFDLSLFTKVGVQFGLFGGSILQLGTERHHERYLARVASLDLPGCFAMTETGHGSNVAEIETTATYDQEAEEFVIDTPSRRASKDWIGNAALHGRIATVFAQLETGGEAHGVHALLVPIRDADGRVMPGVEIEDCGEKAGLHGVDNGRLAFRRVRVPRDALLDRFASVAADGTYESPIASPARRFFTMLGTLVGGRIAVGCAAVTAAKVALATAIRYGARRRQFGPPGEPERLLLDYPAHQRRLLPRLATTYALNFALHELAERYADPDEARRPVEASAAGLKAYASWHATDTVQGCREACGGQGYLAANRLGALKADADVFTTYEGDNTVLMQLVVKDLLTGFRRQFDDFGGVARFLVDRARVAVAERNPIITRKHDEAHLRDPEFQRAALLARRDDLLISLARRVKARTDRGMDGFDALAACQNHALSVARAHVEHEVLEAALRAEPGAPASSIAETFEPLRSLFALSALESDRGWFLEQGYLDPPKTRAIRDIVTALCAELRPSAVPLVDAFRIPPNCLGPIAGA